MSNLRIHISKSPLNFIQRVCDAAVIGSTLYASQWLTGNAISDRTLLAILVAIGVYSMVSEAASAYRADTGRSANHDLAIVLSSWLVTVLLLVVIAFFSRHSEYFARASVLSWIFLAGAALGLSRMLFRIAIELMIASGWSTRRMAIAGLNELGVQLMRNAEANPSCGLKMVGFYDDRAKDRWLVKDHSEQFLGSLNHLVDEAKAGNIDTVFVTLPMRAESRIRWLLEQLADTTVSAYIVPDFFVFELLHSRWNNIGNLPAVSVFETPLYGVDSWLKRAFDLSIATLGLIAISPIMVACAILVKVSSAGPVFFRQRRYGLDGKEIWVWKFRSMRTCDNGSVVAQATKADPRITRIGSVLRKTSLDELPQLFNVIEGSMSLVGPRPHASAHNEHYRKLIRGYMLRHKVKPGITGLAQVEGYRGETETLDKMQKRIDFDHRYIQQWSLWLDFKILVRTLFVVFKQDNAY
ncbi:undecaprenyl-phosphate glucose phosphotransferase [Aureliella helgolandensis]|uniref:UDP-glucose:undecaprenyl-phosphate glucose-1-phosphate transferase n=1 Tax=Aureliella helgolandensis TaxID=2527968 RepID=A0A518G8H7_9BACT|nr:undecaprenyl-phosphate glucose phosphotransferase [Aureliella helgolandensis]QDV24892.1 UDP-glucose:undecaprenyl-phosphate glucose-1-phosphate transferase [Aureliella helgolandensis]